MGASKGIVRYRTTNSLPHSINSLLHNHIAKKATVTHLDPSHFSTSLQSSPISSLARLPTCSSIPNIKHQQHTTLPSSPNPHPSPSPRAQRKAQNQEITVASGDRKSEPSVWSTYYLPPRENEPQTKRSGYSCYTIYFRGRHNCKVSC
jgi:hypothetical protein